MKVQIMFYPIVLVMVFGFVMNPAFSAESTITVWKSASCGCCQKWVDYLQDEGFEVTAHNVDDVVSIKRKLGMTDPALYSCHTAKVGGYLIEGHVPASDIRRLLDDRPTLVGLTAPGMPQMSPGMLSIEPKGYDVLQFNAKLETSVFSSY
ncbi:MAG: metal-binding protein [Candidatus Thioglobus sp. MED-G25]|nr:MAG: metal-binding protein [Candidatus Thioglobus sp. MED-G25]